MQRVAIIFLCIAFVWASPLKDDYSNIVPFKDLGSRIINGDKAAKGQFPWQVAIYLTSPYGTQLCGGALISDSWVLTAGHCVQEATDIRLAMGSNTLSGDDPSRVVMNTNQYIQHEDYNQLNLANDIALIPLPQPVQFSDDIKAVPLSSSPIRADSVVTVSGWGLTSDGGDGASNDLNFVDLVTIPDDACIAEYLFLNDGVMCAQSIGNIVQSTCEGDSGGPLVVNAYSDPIHVGIVSFGHSDGCESGKPSGYTRTDYFRDWITQKTGI